MSGIAVRMREAVLLAEARVGQRVGPVGTAGAGPRGPSPGARAAGERGPRNSADSLSRFPCRIER